MKQMSPRHKYGTFVFIFASLAFLLAIFSTGATWATVDDESTSTIEGDGFFNNITIEFDLQGDLELREMVSEIDVEFYIDEFDGPVEEQTYKESESYEELAEKSVGDASDTFEDMDTAGAFAQWMIWIGIIAMFLTVIFSFCSLAQITNSRFTTYSGLVATLFLFFAPIIWFILLPSDGSYTNLDLIDEYSFFDQSDLMANFDPSPSTGLFLSLLAGLSSLAMMLMIYRHNVSEVVNEKPQWINAIFNMKLNDEEKVSEPINFKEKKEQAGLLLQKSVTAYKSSRVMQALSVLIVLILISIPLYSMLFEEEEEADAYQRDLEYIVEEEGYYLTWIQDTVELSDGETLSFSFTEEDFPTEAKDGNIFLIRFYVAVLDSVQQDNEETSGLGCAANPGQDAPDSVSFAFNTPAGNDNVQIQSDYLEYIEFLEFPGYGPYTGYTVAEIEDMYDASDEIKGDYRFQYTANAEAGSSTFECDRSDSSVTINYAVELLDLQIEVIEVSE